jgi:phosphoglycerate dehydrogenase-like enzyme
LRVRVPRDAEVTALGRLPAEVELVRDGDARMLVLDDEPPEGLDALFAALPSLEVVQTLSAGIEWLVPHVPAGVVVCNASGVHDVPVAEWVVAAILAMEHRFPALWARQAEGAWDRDAARPTLDLPDRTVLVLGHGSIGRAVEARLAPFGARVIGVARRARQGVHALAEAPELAARADVVVVLLPLTPETERVVDAAFLDAMRPGALLVNAARGALVDHDALLERLRAGRLRAALDVTDPEPLPAGHPLWGAPGVLVTPHVAGASERTSARALALVGDQVRRLAAGDPLRNVREGY